MHEVFFEIFENIPRGGPGSNDSTLKALHSINELPDFIKILDIGCGPGKQTVDLAETLTNALIIGIDNHRPFIDIFNRRLAEKKLIERVSGQVGDMFQLEFSDGDFDLIWSEGAIYFIGFERGLREWARLIKPGGYIVVSHIFRAERNVPDEITELFTSQDCEFLTVAENIQMIPDNYELLSHFPLSYTDWWDNFYIHIEALLPTLREKYRGDMEAIACIEEFQTENDLFRKHYGSYGYEFYILQKKV